MKSPEDFAAMLARVETRPIDEQREILLEYFSGVLAEMPAPAVRGLRAHLLRAFPPSPVQDLMIEVLDGHLALGEIGGR